MSDRPPGRPPSEEDLTVQEAFDDGEVAPPQEPRRWGLELDSPSVFDPRTPRFCVEGLLGAGGTSRVFAAVDLDLERDLAIKIVDGAGTSADDSFSREARVTARLAHPNVPPVYDVGRVGDDCFLVLPRIRGRSLRDLIRTAEREERPSSLPPSELVEVLLKVCDALAYAHSRGIVHKDVKPDNIMLGTYGEVMLVDWGTAFVPGPSRGSRKTAGTPAYMAPEQALGATDSPRFDIYALGATLFHALLLRKPIIEPDQQSFWERKLAGDLDLPTRDELATHPRALVAIARRAMHRNPEERYQTITDLARDLRDFLAGGHTWSAPIVEDDFDGPDWRDHWIEVDPGSFERQRFDDAGAVDWGLVSQAPGGALLFYRERLSGGVAIEFEGTILDGAQPGDISVVWTEADVLDKAGAHWPRQGLRTYCFQVGALSNHLVGVFRDFHQPLATRAHRLEVGRPYRIRAEADGRVLRLSLDGEVVAEYEESIPFRSGYAALYAYYPGKKFTRVRLRQRGVPETISSLAVGDAFFVRGHFDDAAQEYRRVEVGQGHSDLAAEARYKRGLCALRTGDEATAFRLWSTLSGPDWKARIAIHQAEVACDAGRHLDVLATLESLLEEHPTHRARVIQLWTELVGRLHDRDDRPLPAYLELRNQHFASEPLSNSIAARALLALGQFERVVEEYSQERIEFCDALLALGQFDRIVEEHSDMTGLRDATLVRQGRLELVSDSDRSQPGVLVAQGKMAKAAAMTEMPGAALAAGLYARVLASAEAGPIERVTAQIRSGRTEEALSTRHPLALLAAGRTKQALERARTLQFRIRAMHQLSLESFLAGALDDFRRYRDDARVAPFSYAWEDMWCDRFVLIPLCEELSGEPGALTTSLGRVARELRHYWCQRAYFVAAHVLGQVTDEEFLAQPGQAGARVRLCLARAVRAELDRDAPAACAAYRAFLAFDDQQRFVDSIYLDPSAEVFARGRLAALSDD